MKKPIHKIWWYWILIFLAWGFINSRIASTEELPVLYLLGFPVIILVSIMIGRNQESKRNSGRPESEKVISNENQVMHNEESEIRCFHLLGIPHIPKGEMIHILLSDENLIVKSDHKKIGLQYNRILRAECVTSTNLLTNDKSVIGRGVAGGLLLGPLGAVVGGISGVGKKNKKGDYLVLNFRNATGDVDVIIFDFPTIQDARKATRIITDRLALEKKEDDVIEL